LKTLNRTKKQLEELDNPFIGIQLRSGGKVFGHIDRFTPHTIYIKDRFGEVLDVSRSYIARAFLLIKGGKEDGPDEFSRSNSSKAR